MSGAVVMAKPDARAAWKIIQVSAESNEMLEVMHGVDLGYRSMVTAFERRLAEA
jgi:adenylate cyclase